MKTAKSIIAIPISEEQFEITQNSSPYEAPITTATNSCVNQMINAIQSNPTGAFTNTKGSWLMTIPSVVGSITIDKTSYPFTLSTDDSTNLVR